MAAISARQHAILTRGQLIELGMTPSSVDNWVNRGRLHMVHRGVYSLVPPAARPPLAAPMGAVLACGEGAVLSHLSAATVWGFWPSAPSDVDVTVVGRHTGPQGGIRVHRTVALDPRDVTVHQGIPITTAARALVEIAGELLMRELERAFDEAIIRRITTRDAVRNAQRRAPGRSGSAALSALTSARGAPRSDAERRFRALIRMGSLPDPEVNAHLGPYEVDFLWRPERLIVEIDGFAFHASRTAFERDHSRDARLRGMGFEVLRFTWRQITHEPGIVLVELARALARRAA